MARAKKAVEGAPTPPAVTPKPGNAALVIRRIDGHIQCTCGWRISLKLASLHGQTETCGACGTPWRARTVFVQLEQGTGRGGTAVKGEKGG